MNISKQSYNNNLLCVIKSCTTKSHVHQVHSQLIRTCLIQDSFVAFHFLSRISLLDSHYARQVLTQIPNPTTYQCNALIRAHSLSYFPQQGLFMYQKMKQIGVPTNALSVSFAIKCCVGLRSLVGGEQIHCRILRDGFTSDTQLLTTLMELYSFCERSVEVRKLFDEMPLRDVVCWNVLISCCLRNRRTKDALALFDRMRVEDNECRPDDVTCLLLLQACASLEALEFGEGVHRYMKENGYGNAAKLCNSLIAMYSRCGNVDKAYEVFQGMRGKTLISWSAMISGLAMNGYGREALEAFDEMMRAGIKPDDQTFTGVLSACSHCGFVDEGLIFFDRMREEFGIRPNIHHYGCMVDLLGRANMLEEAYQLIMTMKVKPDATVWRTLLGACRVHKHVTLGERVIGHLIELKAHRAGDYVLLLNIYSSVGNLDKVEEIRMLMKDRRIQMTPGCSTIELKGVVHEFVVDDVSHPLNDEIYGTLNEVNKQLKIAGYVPEISSELHNLHAEEKGYALIYHSEKLAMAFGVLTTPPGTTIRVASNLRICVDCHNFAKFLSGVYNREVIIRDRGRFHNFREGRCSCNDYW